MASNKWYTLKNLHIADKNGVGREDERDPALPKIENFEGKNCKNNRVAS